MAAIAKIIRILSIPAGDAPSWVREKWPGCELPCELECGHVPLYVTDIVAKQRVGLLTAEEFLEDSSAHLRTIAGFNVPQDIALQVLEMHSPEAAQWFYDNGFPHKDAAFRFRNEEVEVLCTYVWDEVARPFARIYEDLERGVMLRVS